MISILTILTLGLIGSASAVPTWKSLPGCGEVNIIFTGLPPYHPLVTSQGFDADAVNKGLRADAAEVVKAGYNSRVVLMGPEKNISVLADQMNGVQWHGTGVGYGVRGSRLQNLTIRLEDIIDLYRNRAPRGQIMFDYSYTSALWAVQRYFPLSSNCTDSPGKDLGFEIFCDVCPPGSGSSNTSSSG